MHLVVFGASGRTGRPLVEQALAAGHTVRAFVRDPAKLPLRHECLSVVQGDATVLADVARAVEGADAVLSALGPVPGQAGGHTRATEQIVQAMAQGRVRRLVSLTGAGVTDAQDVPSAGAAFVRAVMKVVARGVLADGQGHADAIRRSSLDWTIVRAPRLTDGPRTGVYRVGFFALGPSGTLSRADTADLMLRLATDGSFVRQAPVAAY